MFGKLHPGKFGWQVSPAAQSSLPLGQCVEGEQSAIASPHVRPQNWVSVLGSADAEDEIIIIVVARQTIVDERLRVEW